MDYELSQLNDREMERLEDLVADLRAENERLRERMVDMAMTLNKAAEYQVAELMAENDRLRRALSNLLRLAKMHAPNAGFPQAEEALK